MINKIEEVLGLEILYRAFLLHVSAVITKTVMPPLVFSPGCMTSAFFSAQQNHFLYPEWSNNVMVSEV